MRRVEEKHLESERGFVMYRGYIARCVLVRERETYVDSDVDGDK